MDLLTSYKGKAHLTSMQFRALIESICGSESRIANLDEKMILELAENNTVKIRSGILIHHGAVMQVKRGTYDPITYQNGSQGMKRIDLIVAKYSKSADTKIEGAEWEIIQGEASDSDPVVPTFTEGDMQDGDLIDRCAFAELHFDGINVTEVKQLVPVARNTEELEAELDELNRNLIQSGTELVPNANGYFAIKNITFPVPYAEIPNVTATVSNGDNNDSLEANIFSQVGRVSKTGCVLKVCCWNEKLAGSKFKVSWIAVGRRSV